MSAGSEAVFALPLAASGLRMPPRMASGLKIKVLSLDTLALLSTGTTVGKDLALHCCGLALDMAVLWSFEARRGLSTNCSMLTMSWTLCHQVAPEWSVFATASDRRLLAFRAGYQ
eukprot:4658402-Amphidinium_carterae.1